MAKKYKTFHPYRGRPNSLDGRMALADEFDGLLVDLDGVVWIGREMVPGSVETLATLLGEGKEIVFVTNNSVKPAGRLRCGGCAMPESTFADDRVLTAGAATARLAAERVGADRTAFVIGAPAFHETVAAAGLKLLDGEAGQSADAVVVSAHRELRLRRAADRDPGAAGRRGAVRDQPRPDPADARRRLAGDGRHPRGRRDRFRETR